MNLTFQRGCRQFYCLFPFLKLINEPFSPLKKVFLFNYLNFSPQAVRLSATLALASCSAEHPSIPLQQLKLGQGLELLSEGAVSTPFLPAPVLAAVEQKGDGKKETPHKQAKLFV